MHRDDFAFNSEGKVVVAFAKLSCCGNIKSLTISSGQPLWPSINFLIHVVQICFYTEFLLAQLFLDRFSRLADPRRHLVPR